MQQDNAQAILHMRPADFDYFTRKHDVQQRELHELMKHVTNQKEGEQND